jgi:TrmH family RNA methyltransferase
VLTEKRKKEFASLRRRRYRDALDAFAIEGIRSVDAALDAHADVICLLSTPESNSETRTRRALDLGGSAEVVSASELNRISDVATSQGVILIARRRQLEASELLSLPSVLLLDGVQDPGNVGALVRTAAWFGITGVLAGPGTADFFNAKAVRASMGGIWDVALASSADLRAWLNTWKSRGGESWAADLSGRSREVWKPAIPSALVIGSEAHGVEATLLESVDDSVHIPGSTGSRVTESLNASVAGGILISDWSRSMASLNA